MAINTPKRVRLFVKPYCGWCHEAQDWLETKKIPHEVIDVTASASAWNEMRTLSGQSKAPVLEVDGEILADFDVEELEEFWNQTPG